MSRLSLNAGHPGSDHPVGSVLILIGLAAIVSGFLVLATFGTMFVVAVCQHGTCL
jgi:hypothetical protein